MRNRKAILSSAILAIGGLGLAAIATAQTQSPAQSQRNTPSGTSALSNAADSMGQIKGVQELFARTTDAAVKPNDLQQLKEYYSKEEMQNRSERAGSTGSNSSNSPGTSGGTSGLSARAGSSSSSGNSSGTSGAARNNESSANNQPGATGNQSAASARESRREADTQALNQCTEQFAQAWKEKYGTDFRIQDPTLVYADITAADIMAGQPQAAGSRLQGSGLNNSSNNSNNRPSGSPNSGSTGSSGSSGASHVTGTSPGTSSPGSSMEDEITVNVPAVANTQAVSVRVVREGSNYKFAGHPDRLAGSLEKHLKEVMDQKDRWPSDQKQAERLVTQHVLMAIAETQMHHGNENAEPAGERVRGQSNPQNENSNTTRTPGGSSATGTGTTGR